MLLLPLLLLLHALIIQAVLHLQYACTVLIEMVVQLMCLCSDYAQTML
jgi:hypothetical protein